MVHTPLAVWLEEGFVCPSHSDFWAEVTWEELKTEEKKQDGPGGFWAGPFAFGSKIKTIYLACGWLVNERVKMHSTHAWARVCTRIENNFIILYIYVYHYHCLSILFFWKAFTLQTSKSFALFLNFLSPHALKKSPLPLVGSRSGMRTNRWTRLRLACLAELCPPKIGKKREKTKQN